MLSHHLNSLYLADLFENTIAIQHENEAEPDQKFTNKQNADIPFTAQLQGDGRQVFGGSCHDDFANERVASVEDVIEFDGEKRGRFWDASTYHFETVLDFDERKNIISKVA